MNLLLDLGNTRLKWAWDEGAGLSGTDAQAHAAADWLERPESQWRARPSPEQIWLAAVAAEDLIAPLLSRLSAIFPAARLRRVEAPAAGVGVISAYHEPQRLGVDRFLAMVGARARLRDAAVVAGCGTALAIDLIDAHGHHRGGVIAPSPATMRGAVLSSTARVRPQAPGVLHALGRSTEEALDAGCWLAAAALIDRVVDDSSRQLGSKPRLIVHGGDAERISTLLRHQAVLAHDLVLEGLAQWAESADH